MISLPRAVRVVFFANVLGVLLGAVSLGITRGAGLEWLVGGGYANLVLEFSKIAVLASLFPAVRQTINEAIGSWRTYAVLRTLAFIVSVYAALLLVMLVARLAFGAYATPAHPGWRHYLSLPPEVRPGFLLHYLLVMGFTTALLGPIAEELLFIGVNVRSLQAAGMSRAKMLIGNAVLFVLVHQLLTASWLPWSHLLSLAVGRMLLDTLYHRTGNIAVPICFHILHNTVVTMANLLPFL